MQTIQVTEDELAELIRSCQTVSLAFGPGWVGLKYDETLPMTEAVKRLGLMRGVLNENCEGAGI